MSYYYLRFFSNRASIACLIFNERFYPICMYAYCFSPSFYRVIHVAILFDYCIHCDSSFLDRPLLTVSSV